MQTTKEILTKARSILAKRGWTKGTLRDGDGKVCALGAIYEAYDGTEYSKVKRMYLDPLTKRPVSAYSFTMAATSGPGISKAVTTVQSLLDRNKYSEIPDFNDDPDTKIEDIYAIFDNAILRAS